MRWAPRPICFVVGLWLMCMMLSTGAFAAYFPLGYHDADTDQDWRISLNELLRVIQFYNAGEYHCDGYTEDDFAPGPGGEHSYQCPHHLDSAPEYWSIDLHELLRGIQFYNSGGYHMALDTEEGFAPGPGMDDSPYFAWRELLPGPGEGRRACVCDFNGDEAPDVHVIDADLALSWYENTGAGEFTYHAIPGTLGGIIVHSHALLDVDEDGDTDILGPYITDSGTRWWENDGLGSFEVRYFADYNIEPAIVGDFSGDGTPDVLAWNTVPSIDDTEQFWWRNDSGLVFTPFSFANEEMYNEFFSGFIVYVATVDLDADSDTDILGHGGLDDYGSRLFWYENAGTEFQFHLLTPYKNGVVTTPFADFDADGDLDFVAAQFPLDGETPPELPGCWGWEELAIFYNERNGEFQKHVFVNPRYYPEKFYPASITDIDADGDYDILFCAKKRYSSGSEQCLGWWEQHADGVWNARYIAEQPDRLAEVSVADFDGDGLLDILGQNAAGALGWWENRLDEAR